MHHGIDIELRGDFHAAAAFTLTGPTNRAKQMTKKWRSAWTAIS
jgi:hypothetical protein